MLISKRILFSSRKKLIVPPCSAKPGSSPTSNSGDLLRSLNRRRLLFRGDRGTDKQDVAGRVLRHRSEAADGDRPPFDALGAGDLLKDAAERIRPEHSDHQWRAVVGKRVGRPLDVPAELVEIGGLDGVFAAAYRNCRPIVLGYPARCPRSHDPRQRGQQQTAQQPGRRPPCGWLPSSGVRSSCVGVRGKDSRYHACHC